MRLGPIAISTLAAALCATAGAPRTADACGGFFCSGQQIDQAGERVLFVLEDGRARAHIQIQFQGDADEFSWVVPVTQVPMFDVGSDDVFNALLASTVPRFTREERYEGTCGYTDGAGGDGAAVDGDADGDGDGGGGRDVGPDVNVISSGVAGPYETVVVDSKDPNALVDWLVENDYDVPENARPIIASYVEQGMYFAGLKLAKGQDAGDLRPIVLDLQADEACLPIRLTAIAATQDMPITIWVLADEQAVSTNYPEVWLNDLHLYMQNAPDYAAIVNAALDEAGGRAFLVDYAGSPAEAGTALDPDRYDVDVLRGLTDARAFAQELVRQNLTAHPLMAGLLSEHLPLPPALADEGVTEAQFHGCLDDCQVGFCEPGSYYYYDEDCTGEACTRCYGDELAALEYSFDPNAFADAIDAGIAVPLRDTAAAFARLGKLTRLYTTLSPAEMTEDPIFKTNPDLPDVPRQRDGVRTYHCPDDTFFSDRDEYYEVTTANGLRACYPPEWDFVPSGMPYALLAIQQSEQGEGTVLLDNSDRVRRQYTCSGGTVDPGTVYVPGRRYTDSPVDPWNVGATGRGGGGGLCSLATPAGSGHDGGAGAAVVIALGLAALAFRSRRR